MTITEAGAGAGAGAVIETKLDDEVYLDEEGGGAESGENAEAEPEGTAVAKGSYVVPHGVAVEELQNYDGHKKLRDHCPEAVEKLLTEKGLMDVYTEFVTTLAKERKARGPLGKWRDAQVVSILDLFRDKFTTKSVKVALCKRRSGKGSYRWLEFIDVDALREPYVPQYDVANMSGQVINTVYTKLEFPRGVAVEELKQWSGRKKLKENCPIYVQKLLEKHNLMDTYDQMIDHVIEAGVGTNTKMWNIEKLKEIMEEYKPKFAEKGVDVFLGHKQEYVHHGQYGGHTEFFRWIEYVDRSEQPSYQPQRNAENKDECIIL